MNEESKRKLKEFVESNRFTNAYYVAGYMDAIDTPSMVRDETAEDVYPLKNITDFEKMVEELKFIQRVTTVIEVPSQVKIYQNEDGIKAIATVDNSLLTLSPNGYSLIGPVTGQGFEECDRSQFIMKTCPYEHLKPGDVFFDEDDIEGKGTRYLTSEDLYIMSMNGKFYCYDRDCGVRSFGYEGSDKKVFRLCKRN